MNISEFSRLVKKRFVQSFFELFKANYLEKRKRASYAYSELNFRKRRHGKSLILFKSGNLWNKLVGSYSITQSGAKFVLPGYASAKRWPLPIRLKDKIFEDINQILMSVIDPKLRRLVKKLVSSNYKKKYFEAGKSIKEELEIISNREIENIGKKIKI